MTIRIPLRAAPFAMILPVLAAAVSACGGDGNDEVDFSLAFGEVQANVNQAGFGVANALADVSSCTTDEECVDAGDSLAREYRAYVPVLDAQISALEGMDVPEDCQGLHAAYLEQMKLRVEAGDLYIEGWESFDDALLERSFQKFQESQAKLGDLLDELEALEAE